MARQSRQLLLVTGATGKQGGSALRILREKGFPVRALTRNPDRPEAYALVGHGTEIVRADLNDPVSLTRAMEGVGGVYGVQTAGEEGVDREVAQGTNLITAAQRSRVSHFVYSSVASADRKTGIPHFESKRQIEERLRASGLRHTILRPTFFMENWLRMRETIEQGTLALPLDPQTRLQMIAVRDIGTFVAMAFEHPGRWNGRAIELAGDELSISEIAGSLARLAGRPVQYQQIPWKEFEQHAGHEMTLMWRWFQDAGYNVDIAAVRQEHPSLMNFERWMQSNWRPKTKTA